jgi:enolase
MTKTFEQDGKKFLMKGSNILTVEEIKTAIDSLPEKEYVSLRTWFSEKDWEKWDREIVKDSEAGKLDFLIQEALHEKDRGTLRDL